MPTGGQRGRQRRHDVGEAAHLAPGATCRAAWGTQTQSASRRAERGQAHAQGVAGAMCGGGAGRSHSVATKTTFSPRAVPDCARQIVVTVTARRACLVGAVRRGVAGRPRAAAAAAGSSAERTSSQAGQPRLRGLLWGAVRSAVAAQRAGGHCLGGWAAVCGRQRRGGRGSEPSCCLVTGTQRNRGRPACSCCGSCRQGCRAGLRAQGRAGSVPTGPEATGHACGGPQARAFCLCGSLAVLYRLA